jgi:hypothetical protein
MCLFWLQDSAFECCRSLGVVVGLLGVEAENHCAARRDGAAGLMETLLIPTNPSPGWCQQNVRRFWTSPR